MRACSRPPSRGWRSIDPTSGTYQPMNGRHRTRRTAPALPSQPGAQPQPERAPPDVRGKAEPPIACLARICRCATVDPPASHRIRRHGARHPPPDAGFRHARVNAGHGKQGRAPDPPTGETVPAGGSPEDSAETSARDDVPTPTPTALRRRFQQHASALHGRNVPVRRDRGPSCPSGPRCRPRRFPAQAPTEDRADLSMVGIGRVPRPRTPCLRSVVTGTHLHRARQTGRRQMADAAARLARERRGHA
jgi:hypothetical protein